MRDAALQVVWAAIELAQESPAPTDTGNSPVGGTTVESGLIAMLMSAGPVGVFFAAILMKRGVMTVSEHNTAKTQWERERDVLLKDNEELKGALKDANAVYTQQVIPTLTRVLDAERELVDLRREEQIERRRLSG